MSFEMLTNGQVLAERYQITGTLSHGGAEAMYKATDRRRGTPVSVKEIGFVDEATRQAAEREARLLIDLRHPALPFVLDLFADGQRLYLVTEFIGEENLADRLSRSDSPLPVEDVMDWALSLLDVLEYLHERQPQPILHRHIRPSNIHVKDGQVFLIGLYPVSQDGGQQAARAAVADTQAETFGFASLEQLRGLATTPASDIYSFAATLYVLLTNVAPEDALQRAISESDPLDSIETHRPDLDAQVAQAIMAALALDIKKRPQSAGEMRDLLLKEEADATKPGRRYARALAASVLLASLVLLAGAGWRFYPPPCNKIPLFVSQRVSLKCLAATPAPAPAAVAQLPPEDGVAVTKARSAELTASAAALQQKGDYHGALQTIDAAIRADGNNGYAHAVKCDTEWDTKHEAAEYETAAQFTRMPEVADCAKRIVSLVNEPRTAEDHAALAWAHIALKKYPDAVAHADKAIALKPDLVMAYMQRAVAVLGSRAAPHEPRYQRAVADLLEVLRLRPDYPQAHYLLSQVFYSRDLLPFAEKEANEAIRLYPQAKSFTWLGDIFNGQGQVAKAVEQYNKALDKNSQFVPAYRKLAQIYYDQKNWGGAREILARGLKVRGDDGDLHDLNGLTYLALGNNEKAMEEFHRAIELDPNNFTFFSHRAKCYDAIEDVEMALADKDQAIRLREKEKATRPLTAKDAPLYQSRADTLYQKGDEEAAEEDEKRAQQLKSR